VLKFKLGNKDAVEFDLLEMLNILKTTQIPTKGGRNWSIFEQEFGLTLVNSDDDYLTFIISSPKIFTFAILKHSEVIVFN